MQQKDFIQHILVTLAHLGVREVCVAAGARNAPLVAALTASTNLRLWNFFEERCAAFFAMGRILVTNQPVAVVTTSGTAAAELLPACIEAYYQALPLVLVTADRPERFRGSGAPQAIEQEGLFGVYARRLEVLEAEEAFELDQPIHLNVCLDEPLACDVPGIDFSAHAPHFTQAPIFQPERVEADCVLAAGLRPSEAEEIAPVLAASGLPIVAEATANLHLFRELHEQLVFGGEPAFKQLDARHVLRIGAVPSWRWWRDLENRPEVHVTNLCRAPFPGLARQENVRTLAWGTHLDLPVYGGSIPFPITESCSPLSELEWMCHICNTLTADARVFLGNSLPIREWNKIAPMPPQRTHFYANRGANGIDGLISTFLGVAADHDRESWLILGDLSALYDLAAPWILAQMPAQSRIRIVVINNGGGKIFSQVASLRALPDAARAVIENRHTLSFRPLAELWGMEYCLAASPDDLEELPNGPVVVEVRPRTA